MGGAGASEGETRAADQVADSAVVLARASTSLSLIGHQIRAATASQGARLQDVRTAMATVSDGAEAVAAHAAESSAIAGETQQRAREGAEVVAGVATDLVQAGEAATRSLELIDTLGERVAEVGTIADKIDQVAAKTKLLSLNAAIEAARASDHGRGFAVVAAEIRKLAERSQKAAREIRVVAGNSVSVARVSGERAAQIVPAVRRTADLVQRVASASGEQAKGVDAITRAMQAVDAVAQRNATAAEELSATAQEMAGQTERLRDAINAFRIDGDDARESLR
jgi:methyl-accepting chemotaxis protein